VPRGRSECPFCEYPLQVRDAPSSRVPTICTVNVKEGMPTAREACRRLGQAVRTERGRGVRILKIIHGYGSSGKGGRIRDEVRALLGRMVGEGTVASFVPGEEFRRQSGETKNLLRRFPELKDDSDLGRANQGVTFVVLS